MDTAETPSSSSTQDLLIPIAVIIIIIIVIFILGVIFLLCLRKLLIRRGMDPERWPRCDCCDCECTQYCLVIAENLDCSTPDTKSCLDNICPTKEQCSLFCGRVFSCYCYHTAVDACKNVQLCPDCTACQCPECNCLGNCHCQCTPPECSEINCGCFKISFGNQ